MQVTCICNSRGIFWPWFARWICTLDLHAGFFKGRNILGVVTSLEKTYPEILQEMG